MSASAQAFDNLYAWWCQTDAVKHWAADAFDLPLQQTSHTDLPELEMLADSAELSRCSSVLELGCGAGGIGCYLAGRSGCSWHGVDWSRAAVQHATARARRAGLDHRTRFYRHDLRRPIAGSALYNRVVCVDAFYFGIDLRELLRNVLPCCTPPLRVVLLLTEAKERLRPVGLPLREQNVESFKAHGLALTKHVDLSPGYFHLLTRMSRAWLQHEAELRRAIGDDCYEARYQEDAAILWMLRSGAICRSLLVAERALSGTLL